MQHINALNKTSKTNSDFLLIYMQVSPMRQFYSLDKACNFLNDLSI